MALRQELGNPYGIASSLQNLGIVALYQGDWSGAVRLLRESLAIRTELGYKQGIASVLSNLGQVEYHRQNYAGATQHLQESLRLYLELDDNQSLVEGLLLAGEIAVAQGDAARAARLFGAADAEMQAVAFQLLVPEQAEYERTRHRARTQLGEGQWAAGWAEGRALALRAAVRYALEQDLTR